MSSDTISLSITDAAISIATSGNSGDVSHEIPAQSEIVSHFTADPATANSTAVKYRYGTQAGISLLSRGVGGNLLSAWFLVSLTFSIPTIDEPICLRTSFLKQALRPLAISDKVSLRVDSSETLCLQYMVSVGENKSFLEFYCRPVEQ